jgi:hypothetical protein
VETLTPGTEERGAPSLSQAMVRGGSPLDTPHTARVRVPCGRPSPANENGSIIGGTESQKKREKKGNL